MLDNAHGGNGVIQHKTDLEYSSENVLKCPMLYRWENFPKNSSLEKSSSFPGSEKLFENADFSKG